LRVEDLVALAELIAEKRSCTPKRT
jgi:hypothetical protein